MSKTGTSLFQSFLVFVLFLIIGILGAVRYQTRTSTNVEASVGPTPNPVPEVFVDSSNAEKKLMLRTTVRSDGAKEYIYTVSDISGGNPRILLDKTTGPGVVMKLPFNSWDPTDTYVFLEADTAGIPDYLVQKANGEPFADGSKYIDVGKVWAAKDIGYSIRDATGWASGTLLIIYTTAGDGSNGPAFWFEIPSTAIIQLSG